MSLLDTPGPVLFVHAHPDDETIATGALMAELAGRDVAVVLLTATRGERGEVVPGVLDHIRDPETLTAERERELQRAITLLGVAQHAWLGETPARAAATANRVYRDSGMAWIRPGQAGPASDITDDALARAPLAEVTADVVAMITNVAPALVISYDDGGGYGHPDHVRMHQAAYAAAHTTGTAFAEIVDEPGSGVEWIELDHRLDVVRAALHCHQSQLKVDGDHLIHSGGQRLPITTSVGLRLTLPSASAGSQRR